MSAEQPPVDPRGREADRPSAIPAEGWKDIAVRVKQQIREDQVTLLAAGVAFYAMLALFPTLIAFVSLYGLVADPEDVYEQFTGIAEAMPQEAADLLLGQLETITTSAEGALTTGFVVSLLGVLWTASSGVQGLIRGVNTAYDQPESRGFLKLRGLALLLTVGGLLLGAVAFGAVAILPVALGAVGLDGIAHTLVLLLRWPLLAAVIVVALAVVYRYAPDRTNPQWRWVTWGAGVATLLWLLGSIAFSVYVNNFGDYQETYGALGAVIILLLWLFLSAFVVLLGAELDAEMEHQTAHDSTVSGGRPMGHRGAEVADSVGEARS